MTLTVVLGATVTGVVDGHSATNGAVFPDGSTIAAQSSNTSVATVPASVAIPAGGTTSEVSFPITVVASGSADISVVLATPDGTKFTDTASVIVTPVVPGLTHVTLTLTSP